MTPIEDVTIVKRPHPPMSPILKIIVAILTFISTISVAVLLVFTGGRLERDACIVRAYEHRIDVDLAKKICAFGATLPIPVVSMQQSQTAVRNAENSN